MTNPIRGADPNLRRPPTTGRRAHSADALDLEPLALEGGLFRRTFTGGGATAILFMLIGDDFSAMHRLHGDEVYFHHSGHRCGCC